MAKVRDACESARQNPGEENAFRQLRLDQWVKQSVRWMPMEKWDACAFPVDAQSLAGRVCYGGLDLSSTTDITAFVLVFPPEDESDKYQVLPYFWIPEENVDLRVKRDHVPYDVWKRQGFLRTTEGNVVHYGFIEQFIGQLGERYNIREIAFDRWGAVQMTQNLEDMGFTVVPFGQGYKDMSPPTKELMKLTLEQKIASAPIPPGTSRRTRRSRPRKSTVSSRPSWRSTGQSGVAVAAAAPSTMSAGCSYSRVQIDARRR